MKRLSSAALAVLADGITVHADRVEITAQLERQLYVEVDKALRTIGGQWTRKARAHIFHGDPRDALDQILADGGFRDVKQELEQFFTPAPLARQLVEMADVEGMAVLEPSAGEGAIVAECLRQGAKSVRSFDISERCCQALARLPYFRGSHCPAGPTDFLLVEPKPYDRVVMNPPFSRQKDIEHVEHALRFLQPRGLLVAVMSAGVEFRQDRRATAFRARVTAAGGTIERLPEGSFKASGTSVNTVVVRMRGGA